MTKEERAEKWFRNIPNAETIDLETRMEICSKVAKRMVLVFFAVFALELVLLSLIVGDDFFNGLADFVNSLIGGSHNRGSRTAYRLTPYCHPCFQEKGNCICRE